MKRDLIALIESLPEREKNVLSLSYFENLNNKEIAHVLGISEQSVLNIREIALNKCKRVCNIKQT